MTIKIYSADHVVPIEGEILSPGALAVQDGTILAVDSLEALAKSYPAAEVKKFPGAVIMPGLVNAHTDLSLSQWKQEGEAGRGAAPAFSLMRWLIQISRYKTALSLDDQQKSIESGLAACRHWGVTTVGDVCRYPVAISLYEKSGLRVACLAEIENIQRALAQSEFEQALALVDEVRHQGSPRLTAGLAPLAAFTLSKNLLRIVVNHAVQMQIPLHLMAALSFSEMEFFYDSMGEVTAVLFKEAGWEEKIPPAHRMTPIQYLQEIGLLKARPALFGGLHLGPTDAALIKNSGSLCIFAPLAFHYLQVGEIPWKKIFKAKTPWALSSLGPVAGSAYNPWAEMREVLYQLEEDRESVARMLLRAATLEAAQTLGLEKITGSLVKNKQADFIVVKAPEADENLCAGLIEQTQKSQIQNIFVAGKVL